jgi:ankyrin repeat protein
MAQTLMQQAVSLVESGRDINESGCRNNDTLLHAATDHNDNDVIRYLVGHGADINKPNRYGNTPFHYYVFRQPDIQTVKYLLDNGADVDRMDCGGRTVAGRARAIGNIDVAEFIESYVSMPTKGVMNG